MNHITPQDPKNQQTLYEYELRLGACKIWCREENKEKQVIIFTYDWANFNGDKLMFEEKL